MTEVTTQPDQLTKRVRVVVSLMAAMTLAGLANGLIYAFVPIRLDTLGFEPWVAGSMIAVLAVGGLAGCFLSGPTVHWMGRPRAFLAGLLLLLSSHAVVALTNDPVLWAASRLLYGTAMTLMFVVSQSWINAVVTNQARGKIQATYNTLFIVGLGVGGYGIGFVDLSGSMAPQISIVITLLAMLPLLLPGLPSPPLESAGRIRLLRAWQISPIGFVGMFCVGGLTLLIQGFAPIYGQASGFSPAEIGRMMLFMQLGIIGVQLAAGAISDQIDRRWVLIASGLAVVFFAGITSQVTGLNFYLLVAAFGLWAGATETVFAVASAQAYDHAEPSEYVMLSATLITLWSLGAAVIPAGASFLTDLIGVTAYMYVAGGIGLLFTLFVIIRMFMRDPPEPSPISEPPGYTDAPLP